MRQPTQAQAAAGKGDSDFAHTRAPYDEFLARVRNVLPIPECVFDEMGKSCSIEQAIAEIEKRNAHGALDPIEGAVWRVERISKDGQWEVDFLAKYVRPGKVDGQYLPELTGQLPVWNWHPGQDSAAGG